MTWTRGEEIAVYTINDRGFPYRLIIRPGTDSAQVVAANMLERADNRPARAGQSFSITGG